MFIIHSFLLHLEEECEHCYKIFKKELSIVILKAFYAFKSGQLCLLFIIKFQKNVINILVETNLYIN